MKATPLKTKVLEWLDQSHTPNTELDGEEVPDGSRWAIQITWPEGTNWNTTITEAENEPGCLQMFAKIVTSPGHKQALAQLNPDARLDFLWKLRRAVAHRGVFDRVVASAEAEDEPEDWLIQGFLVEVRAYLDGLNKTVFFDKLLDIHNCRASGIEVYQSELDVGPPWLNRTGEDGEDA